MLIVFAGLPGVGKTTIARAVARALSAVYVRVDSIEQAIRDAGVVPGDLGDAGYRAAHAVAGDNLRLGRIVVADCVNPWMLTRDAWRSIGVEAGVVVHEVEVVCSSAAEHRARIESRQADIPGLLAPDWSAVIDRDNRPWTRDHLVVDTAHRTVESCIAETLRAIQQRP